MPRTQLRSEERKVSGVVKFYLNSAPLNGVEGRYCCCSIYKHVTPNGVKTAELQIVETPFLDSHRCFPYDHTSTRSGSALIFEKGTYVNGRRLPLQGRGWGFESLRAHQTQRSEA